MNQSTASSRPARRLLWWALGLVALGLVTTTGLAFALSFVLDFDSTAPTRLSFAAVCDVNEADLTDPQLERHARSFEGRTFTAWHGWVYDVVHVGNRYDLHIAMQPRGLLWHRDVVIEDIPTDLAFGLNVEQPITFDGRIAEVRQAFGALCNPLIVDYATVRE